MMNEMDRLRDCTEMFELLTHYAELGREDRETWHDRHIEYGGRQGRDLARLYGELIAHGWLEQNTGITPILQPNRHGACYRVTSAGLKACKQVKKELTALASV